MREAHFTTPAYTAMARSVAARTYERPASIGGAYSNASPETFRASVHSCSSGVGR
jgi:hypothetical protein